MTDDYWFELDEYRRASGEQFLLAHIRVHRWAPSVFKRMFQEFKILRTCVTAPLFAVPEVDDARWRKFVSAFGFRFLHDTVCNNGLTRPIFIHTI